MIVMSVHHHHNQHHHHGAHHHHLLRHRPSLFLYIRFKCPVRPDLRQRSSGPCHYHHGRRHLLSGSINDTEDAAMIVVMTAVGDTQDATMIVVILVIIFLIICHLYYI